MNNNSQVWYFILMFLTYLVISSTLAGCVAAEPAPDHIHREYR